MLVSLKVCSGAQKPCPVPPTFLFSALQGVRVVLRRLRRVFTVIIVTCGQNLQFVCGLSPEDAGHLVQSPAAQGMARSLSEIVQQLFADDQLSQDCAHALGMQLGTTESTSMQQMQGESSDQGRSQVSLVSHFLCLNGADRLQGAFCISCAQNVMNPHA